MINLSPQKLESSMWSPRVFISIDTNDSLIDRCLTWNRIFKTKNEADDFALIQVLRYIRINLV